MTFGVLGVLIAIAVELAMVSHWLRMLRDYPKLTRRKRRLMRVMTIALPAIMFAVTAGVAALLATLVIPIAAQPIPRLLLPFVASFLALWLLGWGGLCCVRLIGMIRGMQTTP